MPTHPCITPGCRTRTLRANGVCGHCARAGTGTPARRVLDRYGVAYADAARMAAALDLLERNRQALERAMDDAGVPAASRVYQGIRRALSVLLGRVSVAAAADRQDGTP